eukprot:06473.XXX_68623_68168_1 [CDS] Oithona nana genome sequencing.
MKIIALLFLSLSLTMAAHFHPFDEVNKEVVRDKRPTFMGQSVSNLQYIQLTELQEAAIRADVYMKSLADKYDENTLRQNPQWRELVSLANSLSDLIPQEVKNENREVAFWY